MKEDAHSGRGQGARPSRPVPRGRTAACRGPILYAADLGGCAALQSLSPAAVAALFAQALERAGATIVHRVSHLFPGGGMTCALVLSESHAVLHTWPESGSVSIDIFSCSDRLGGPEAIAELSRTLGARSVAVQELPRADGLLRQSAARG